MPKKIYYENIAKTIIRNLEKRQMKGFYVEDSKSALEKVLELVPEGASVGWGGSSTLKDAGILQAMNDGPYTVYDRKKAVTKEEQKAIYSKICGCDYYFTSTNAITLDGELVNIDCTGNRVAFLCFGPENVIVVAGMNKIVTDVAAGIERTKNFAAPPNAVRLNRNTPCAVTGRCGDCKSPDCLCAQTVVTSFSPAPGRITVILVGEELGY